MPKVTYVAHDGARHEVDLPSGTSIMQGAIDNMIDGIVGDCGGSCSCATCHCYIDAAWTGVTGVAEEAERVMLEFVFDPQENSRLSCQVMMREELDGLVVFLPENQM